MAACCGSGPDWIHDTRRKKAELFPNCRGNYSENDNFTKKYHRSIKNEPLRERKNGTAQTHFFKASISQAREES